MSLFPPPTFSLPIFQHDDPEDLLERFLALLDSLGISYLETSPPADLDTPSLTSYFEVWLDEDDE